MVEESVTEVSPGDASPASDLSASLSIGTTWLEGLNAGGALNSGVGDADSSEGTEAMFVEAVSVEFVNIVGAAMSTC